MSKVQWPKGVRDISLSRFNRSVDDVKWPTCLEVLSFHTHSRSKYESETMAIFNMPLDGVTFPTGLREIYLGFEFNQPIENVDWPEGLEKLSMAGFNQSTQDVQWPSGLKTLEFSKPCQFEYRDKVREVPWDRQRAGFNQPLGTFLPMSIDTLWLSDTFNQSLEGVTWPSGLTVLGLGTELTQESIDGVGWPPSLRTLVCEDVFIDIYDPPSCCRVVLIQSYVADMNEEGSVGWYVGDENYDSSCSYDSE